ncbi:MAG TPA: hypothetical protein DDX92_07625 [Flavobacteriales bacterium]|jgi:hypothetical protein|nr:hypothetical protein [Flavobacteriales bacterium]
MNPVFDSILSNIYHVNLKVGWQIKQIAPSQNQIIVISARTDVHQGRQNSMSLAAFTMSARPAKGLPAIPDMHTMTLYSEQYLLLQAPNPALRYCPKLTRFNSEVFSTPAGGQTLLPVDGQVL